VSADFGFQGFPARPAGVDRIAHYRTVLEMAPPILHSFYGDRIVFHLFGPTPTDAVRESECLVDVGLSHFQVSFDDMATYRRFIDDVVPVVRLTRQSAAGSEA